MMFSQQTLKIDKHKCICIVDGPGQGRPFRVPRRRLRERKGKDRVNP